MKRKWNLKPFFKIAIKLFYGFELAHLLSVSIDKEALRQAHFLRSRTTTQ